MAASVLCVGFQDAALTDETESTLHALQPGAVILFARHTASFAQTRALTDRLRLLIGDGLPPVIAVDQEGGRVARLRDRVDAFPSMMALSATGDTDLARRAGERIGFDLRRAGFNLNFGPVLDLATHQQNTVIGTRAFSDDPQTVVNFGGAFAAGMESAGVVATYKHFPGHGPTATDSHLALPRVEIGQAQLRSRDLIPFAALLRGARAVMTAHIVVAAFDAVNPATTSYAILSELLRRELKFKGACFTDCMHMDAISKSIGTPQGAVKALAAGADCVSITQHLSVALEAVDRIVAAVQTKELPLRRLQEAANRMSMLREGLQPPLDAPRADEALGIQVARRAITLVRGSTELRGSPLGIVSFQGSTVEGVAGRHESHASLADVVRHRGMHVIARNLPLAPSLDDVSAVIADLVASNATVVVLTRRAHIYEHQGQAVHALLRAFPHALLISMREPFDVHQFPEAVNVVCAYDDESVTVQALGELLSGGERATGIPPVELSTAR